MLVIDTHEMEISRLFSAIRHLTYAIINQDVQWMSTSISTIHIPIKTKNWKHNKQHLMIKPKPLHTRRSGQTALAYFPHITATNLRHFEAIANTRMELLISLNNPASSSSSFNLHHTTTYNHDFPSLPNCARANPLFGEAQCSAVQYLSSFLTKTHNPNSTAQFNCASVSRRSILTHLTNKPQTTIVS